MRDALHGFTRFDEFQKSLIIAPNMLTRRSSALVDAGLLERRRYSDRPPRYEFILTGVGRDFRPVIVAMCAWGNRHFAPEGASVLLVNKKTRRATMDAFRMIEAPSGMSGSAFCTVKSSPFTLMLKIES